MGEPASTSQPAHPAPQLAFQRQNGAAASLDFPLAGPTRRRRRHWLVIASFLVLVLLPVLASAHYLWMRAADQYASRVAFSVRTEEASSAIELLGGVTELSGLSSSDTDILFDFLQSQGLVARIDDSLDLAGMWSRPVDDVVFGFDPSGTIEDLRRHWLRMVQIAYDTSTGLIDIRVLAFAPADAQAIAAQIQQESTRIINELSDIARNDAIEYARIELERAEARLAEARLAMTAFRTRTQIVDPSVDTQGQMGLVTNLQAQLAEALIDLDVLRDTTRSNDTRLEQAERRIEVIEERIEAERAQLGTGRDGTAYAELVAEFERLSVDQEFAQEAYTAALAGYDMAQNDARRQSRYLAAHIEPTLAQSAEYPQREILLLLIVVASTLLWSTLVLIGYALRDRR